MTKRFKSVEDLVGHLYEDKEEAKKTKAHIRSKELARILTVLRNHAGASQMDMARKLNWSQSKVSKVEHLSNNNFTMGDLEAYTEAIDFRIEISFLPKNMKLVDRVKYYFSQMKVCLDRLSGLAKSDAEIQAGIDRFMKEAGFNLLLEAAACLEKGKASRKEAGISILPPILPDEGSVEAGMHANA